VYHKLHAWDVSAHSRFGNNYCGITLSEMLLRILILYYGLALQYCIVLYCFVQYHSVFLLWCYCQRHAVLSSVVVYPFNYIQYILLFIFLSFAVPYTPLYSLLHCAIVYYAVLIALQYYTVLCHTIMCWAVLYCIQLCHTRAVVCSGILYYIVLYCDMLIQCSEYTLLFCTAL
jgi:hypothetical protein